MLIDAVMRSLNIEDKSGWPEKGEVRVSHDPDTGLPIIEWLEYQLSSPQACFAAPDAQGVPQFIVCDAGSARMMENRHTRPGLDVRSHVLLICVAFCVLPLVMAYHRSLSYRFGDDTPPLMVFLGVFFLQAILVAIGVFAYGVWRAIQMRRGAKVPIAETFSSRPWSQLQGFRISDERAEYGHIERDKEGREVQPSSMLMADFGNAAPPMVVTGYNWALNMTEELRRVLTHEFIDRREEYLSRMARAERTARNAEIGERKKVI